MAYRFFVVPIRDNGSATAELNGFIRSHRVLAVDRRWVDAGWESYWSFCVDYLEHGGNQPGPPVTRNGAGRAKVDYREVLSPEDFAVFARLRQARKEIAQAEAVPVYTVFTNEQLAQMVQARAASKSALEKIAGVGDARIDKYGERSQLSGHGGFQVRLNRSSSSPASRCGGQIAVAGPPGAGSKRERSGRPLAHDG